jgi:hypothetical protein
MQSASVTKSGCERKKTYVAVRHALRERGRERARIVVRKAHRRARPARVRRAPLRDLEPARARPVPRRRRRPRRHLAQVDRCRPEVVDGVVELEAEGRARGDGDGRGRARVGVADVVGRGRGGDWAVVHRLADGGSGGGRARDEGRPDVCEGG